MKTTRSKEDDVNQTHKIKLSTILSIKFSVLYKCAINFRLFVQLGLVTGHADDLDNATQLDLTQI